VVAVIVGAAGAEQAAARGDLGVAPLVGLALIGVPNLEGVEAGRGPATDELFFARGVGLIETRGMGQRRDAAGGADAVDGLAHGRIVAFHIRRTGLAEKDVEGFANVGSVAAADEQRGEVRAGGDVLTERLGILETDIDTHGLQAGGDGAVALAAFPAQAEQPVAELRSRVVEEVGQQVGIAAAGIGLVLDARAQLDAADQLQAFAGGGRAHSVEAGESVVVGDGQRVQAGSGGAAYQLLGRVGTVRSGGVGVQVDHRGAAHSRDAETSRFMARSESRLM